MGTSRNQYHNVTDFPRLFFEGRKIKEDIVNRILTFAAAKQRKSMGVFIKFLIKIINKGSFKPYNSRIQFLYGEIESKAFRTKWYANTKSSELLALYNYTYYFSVKSQRKLREIEKDNTDIFWHKNSGIYSSDQMFFFNLDGFEKFLDLALSASLPDDILSLYIWSFWEAHYWHDCGSSQNENAEDFIKKLQDVLTEKGAENILRLCRAPEEVPAKTEFKIVEVRPSTKRNSPKVNFAHAKVKNNATNFTNSKGVSIPNGAPESFLRYQDIIDEIIRIRNSIDACLETQRYSDLEQLSKELTTAEKVSTNCLSDLKKWFESQHTNLAIPLPPSEAHKDSHAAEKYIGLLCETIHKCLSQKERSLKQKKEILYKNFQSIGLEVPREIEDISTENDLIEFENRWEPEIEEAKAIRDCQLKGFANSFVRELNSKQRLRIYNKLLDSISEPSQLLNVFISILEDPRAFKGTQEGTLTIVSYLQALIRHKVTLPYGVWAFVKDLGSEDIVKEISDRGIFDELEESAEVDFEALSAFVSDKLEILPAVLRRRLILHDLQYKEPSERIETLFSLILEDQDHEQAVRMLFETFCETSRYGEAIYLVSLFKRNSISFFSDEELTPPLILLFLDSVMNDTNKEIVIDFIHDFGWITNRDTEIVAFLFLFMKTQSFDSYINFIYQSAEGIESARINYPLIMHYLINEIESLNIDINAVNYQKRQYEQAKSTLKEFLRDLSKTSCYSNWPPALKYQKYFRDKLSKSLEHVRNTGTPLSFNANTMIEEAYTSGLPKVVGTAITSMKRYLQNQIERLQLLSELSKNIDISALQKETDTLTVRLTEEYSKFKSNKILKIVYEAVLETF